MEDNTATFKERQDDAPAVISDVSATEQLVSEDIKQTPEIPKSSEVSSHDHKEDLEETKDGHVQSEPVITTKELDVKKIKEEVQIPPVAQSPTVTPSNAGIVATQNTGVISSVGNVEAPSSLSFEFKFNIQFGQAKAEVPPSPTTERTEPVKKVDVSEVGVQAEKNEEPIRPTQKAESQKQAELTEVTVQATEIIEPAAKLDSTERPVITTQPVLLDVCIQATERVESEEQIKATETATSSVQAAEIIEPVKPTENREVILSQPVLSQCCDQETKVEEPVKQKEEETDQDVWMDAEEDINTQEEKVVSHHEVEESLEPQAGGEQEEKAGPEMHKTAVTVENDSEGEDFDVALEDLEIPTASVSIVE
ncbi:probable serine/threonine-protein kinase kinX [Centropristis striata]|uniref:probable serine/threonine-protein kinase kinX n=1 Tax=Centropristis striata TaxID=184440 RepID=UPI0027E2032F|nr:probable serine/threonine-protein kinase kinX [Centropristis striata]